MKKMYNIKKTISMKQFISEFGGTFTEQMKNRLLELEMGCVLIRKEENHHLQLKHVQHTKYACPSGSGKPGAQKEYAYGQFIVIEGILYFAEDCKESDQVMEAPVVSSIYEALDSEDMITTEGINAKKIDDSNIDFVINSILEVFPEVSKEYQDIVKGMLSLRRN